MLHIEKKEVRKFLLEGNFGLERENQRITMDGFLAQSQDPFSGNKNIVKDFSESQTEINTNVNTSAEDAIDELYKYTQDIHRTLVSLENQECLWPFSNPPYIKNESQIRVAEFTGEDVRKTEYREYLSDRYGRYKMSLCGIHINYSFSDTLLREDFKYSSQTSFQEYKNELYLQLAKKVAVYGWILTVVCAASPILDSSYVEKGVYGKSVFNGMASTRCSEFGYWNVFSPVFDYSTIKNYANGIQQYVEDGLITAPSELYYPVRLKPVGINNLETLKEKGVNHIELRNIDLNPLEKSGLNIKDLRFAQLLLIWLASTEDIIMDQKEQVQAIQNYKNASHYDLKTVKISIPGKEVCSVVDAGLDLIQRMKEFYKEFSQDIQEILQFEEDKLLYPEKRYAWIVRKEYEEDFVNKGLELAKKQQKEAI